MSIKKITTVTLWCLPMVYSIALFAYSTMVLKIVSKTAEAYFRSVAALSFSAEKVPDTIFCRTPLR